MGKKYPKGPSYREDIFIDGERTVEVDYSGLHIVLLYAQLGLNYWNEADGGLDPYAIDLSEMNGWSDEQKRALAKATILIAVNAKTEKSAFNAIRRDKKDYELPAGVTLSDALLKNVLDALKAKHPLIANKLCSGAGIDLQYIDSQITENLIQHFTEARIPLLPVHDSYIVPHAYALELREQMDAAFAAVTKLPDLKTDWLEKLDIGQTKAKQKGYSDEAEYTDPKLHKEIMDEIASSYISKRYKDGLREFREHMERKAGV